jgi:hypothetical protein
MPELVVAGSELPSAPAFALPNCEYKSRCSLSWRLSLRARAHERARFRIFDFPSLVRALLKCA